MYGRRAPQTAPAITLARAVVSFTTPHHQPARKRARIGKIAWSPRNPSTAISNPRQLGVARDLHASHARGTRPNTPHRHFHSFFFYPPLAVPWRHALPGAFAFVPAAPTPRNARPRLISTFDAPLRRVRTRYDLQRRFYRTLRTAPRRDITLRILSFGIFFPPDALTRLAAKQRTTRSHRPSTRPRLTSFATLSSCPLSRRS